MYPVAAAPGDWTFVTVAGVAEGGIGARDGVGTAARFNYPGGAAVAPDGTIYISDILNHTIRKISPTGIVTTLAGLAGEAGTTDGRGATSRFSEPRDVALDADGNVYVADSGNHTIRKITPAGVVSTLAGAAGSPGSANGTGKSARFRHPGSVALDTAGNVYVADTEAHTVRKITPVGAVTTLAGSANVFGSSDGQGSAARFRAPQGIATDAAGNIYVADTSNHTIRKVSPDGTVTTLAGTAGQSGSTDGTGNAARFNQPFAIESAPDGTLYLSDAGNRVIRKISASGEVTTLAGKAGSEGSTDGTGTAALFYSPLGIAAGPGEMVYVGDSYNHTIRAITAAGAVTTFAGSSSASGTNDGPALLARFKYTLGPAITSDGTLYVSDVGNHTIRKISPAGEVSTFAGTIGTSGTNDGVGTAASFQSPLGLAVDAQNNVFVADNANHTIRKITPAGEVTTFAGAPGSAGTNDGVGAAARFRNPQAVTIDKDNNVFVADTMNHTIRRITPAGEVTTFAGTPGSSGSQNGTGGSARFNLPLGISTDGAGNLHVADTYNHILRKITPAGAVTTLAGAAGSVGSANGSAQSARFNYPFGIAADPAGVVYVADQQNHLIRRVAPSGDVTTIGGAAGAPGSVDGTGGDSRFNYPYSLAVDASGNLFVADTYNHSLRKGFVALADSPVATPSGGAPGTPRQLDVANLSTIAWTWNFERFPSGSAAALSSASARNPSFTPDVPDVYVLRMRGTDSQGRVAFGTLSVSAIVETVNPTLSITSPKKGLKWTQPVLTMSGTAGDNTGVAEVWCRVNSQPWVKANGTTSWSVSLSPDPGANTLQAYAIDQAGNNSATASVNITYVLSENLAVVVTGQGTLSPNYQNSVLEVGKTYKVTAKPAAGQIFSHWEDETGAVLSRSAALTFTMRTGLRLEAVFAPNPFVPARGSYAGLVYDPDAVNHANSGLFTATVTDKGTFSAKISWAGASFSHAGQFAADGSYSNAIARKGSSPLPVQLQLGLAGEKTLVGTLGSGPGTSTVLANQAVYSAANPGPLGNRKYTFVIPGADDSTSRPGGYGYGTVSLTSAGAATIAGVLGDGTKFTQKTFLSEEATLPFYVPLYSAKGSILGWLTAESNGAPSDLTGTLYWTKLAGAAGLYPSGFSFPEGIQIIGSLLNGTAPILNWGSGYIALERGGLTQAIESHLMIAANKGTGTNKLTLAITPATGLFKGKVTNPATGQAIAINGVVLQKQGIGYGYFPGSGQTGRVRLAPDL